MLCYKDRTFCKSDCTDKECYNYMYEGVEQEASEFGLPIAYTDLYKNCSYYKPPTKE